MIGARLTMMGGSVKPYDAEVEYLESTGTQWIDTGIEPNTELAFSGEFISFGGAGSNNYASIQGVREGDGNTSVDQFSFTVYDSTESNWVGFGAFQTGANCANQQFEMVRVSVVFDKTGLTVGGVKKVSYSGKTIISLGRTIYLFGRNTQGFVNPFVGRLYSAKYTLNGVLIRDFVPVRKGKIGYLYDRVSGKLFGNEGTGAFVLGPDVEEQAPISAKSYVQDGLVAMWDGIENEGLGKSSNKAILTNLVTGEQFVAPNGVTRGDGFFDVAKGISWTIGEYENNDNLAIHTLECVGCLTSKPTSTANMSGNFSVRKVGSVAMFRKVTSQNGSGIMPIANVTNSGIEYTSLKGAKSTLTEADNEVFGVSRYRAVVMNKAYANTYGYINDEKRTATATSWTDALPSTSVITAPSATSTTSRFHRLAIYNRALTDAEIAHNYAVDKERFGL